MGSVTCSSTLGLWYSKCMLLSLHGIAACQRIYLLHWLSHFYVGCTLLTCHFHLCKTSLLIIAVLHHTIACQCICLGACAPSYSCLFSHCCTARHSSPCTYIVSVSSAAKSLHYHAYSTLLMLCCQRHCQAYSSLH